MRLQILNQYRPSIKHRLLLLGMRTMFGPSVTDAVRAGYYRQEHFSKPFYNLMQAVLRGPSEWSIGERELLAAVVAARIHCAFCTTAHSAWAAAELNDPDWIQSALTGDLFSEANPKLNVMLRFLEKLTQQPWNVTCDDVQCLRAQGLSDQAIQDAVMVCVVFSIGSRLAHMLGLEVLSPATIRRLTPFVLRAGYRVFTM